MLEHYYEHVLSPIYHFIFIFYASDNMGIITTDPSTLLRTAYLQIIQSCNICGFVRKCIISQILFRKMCKCKIDDRDVGLWGGGTLDR